MFKPYTVVNFYCSFTAGINFWIFFIPPLTSSLLSKWDGKNIFCCIKLFNFFYNGALLFGNWKNIMPRFIKLYEKTSCFFIYTNTLIVSYRTEHRALLRTCCYCYDYIVETQPWNLFRSMFIIYHMQLFESVVCGPLLKYHQWWANNFTSTNI